MRIGEWEAIEELVNEVLWARGCIAYSPRLAARQLMRTQTVPYKKELGGLCFFYNPSHRDGILAVCRAWEKPIYMGDGELGKPRVTVSGDYEKWRNNRGCLSHPPKMHLL
ncbi:hypothetical protein Fmac_011405 [Flemingia macrophylla]|uniref:DUF7745 domain-containing protein n=1 Tax=Flemingia macrophylla TaxID=520843 RepID=A0ABD1MMD0_9FABA